jgi:hypothetical protein
MPTKFTVDSSVCGHRTDITATMGKEFLIALEITTTCELVKAFSGIMKEIRLMDVAKRMCQNPIYIKATDAHLHSNCLVPCGVALSGWAESGMMSKNLLKSHSSQCVIYSPEDTKSRLT